MNCKAVNNYDCCLVVPNWVDLWEKHEYSNKETLGAQYLFSALNNSKISCWYLNAYAENISIEEVTRKIICDDIKVVAISCTSQRSYPSTKYFVDELRKNSYLGHICVGGLFASLE